MRTLLSIAGLALFLIGAAVWFTSRERVEHATETIADVDVGGVESIEEPATELEDPDAVREAADSAPETEGLRVSLASEAKPEPAAAVDQSKPAAPLEFAVVDERSQLPLPRFLVRLSDSAGRTLDVVTDDRGNAVSEPLALGPVQAALLDYVARRGKPPALAIDHIERPSRPHLLSVASGPTYRVVVAPTSGPDVKTLGLRLTLDNEDGESRATPAEPLRTEPPFWREGEEHWVRFRALEETLTRGRRIDVSSKDGLWNGSAPASLAFGEAVQPVRIQLEACAVLRGRVTAGGAPLAGVAVTFQAPPEAGRDRGYSTSANTDGNGDYRLEFVRPREGTMKLSSLLCEPAGRSVSLRPGDTQVQDFDLVLLPTVGRVAGTLVSESGAYEPNLGAVLYRAGRNRSDPTRLRENVRWKTVEGRRVGEFDFGLLPKGKYQIEFDRVDWFEWTPRRIDVEAPKEDLVVRIADRTLVADFAVEIRDADNGLPLKRAHIVLETIGGERSKWIGSGDVVLSGYPEDKRLRWRLDVAGYPSQIGDMKSFSVTTLVDGRRRRTAEILVQPGWSEVVRVTHGKDEKPIANAAVIMDGVEAGKTDKDGQLRISAREKPKSVTVQLQGWRLDGGIDLRAPSQRNYRRFIEVRMRQTKKK